MKHCVLLFVALCAVAVSAAGPDSVSLPAGGLEPGAIVNVSGKITLRESDGPRGQYKHGFRVFNDSLVDS